MAGIEVHRKVPDLLCPVGVYEGCLDAAVDNGADAIYVGVWLGRSRDLNDRLRSDLGYRGNISCFTVDEIGAMVSYCARHDVEVQVALNNLLTDRQRDEACACVEGLSAAGVRRVVIADAALMKWVRTTYPEMVITASVVGGTTNHLTAETYKALGASCVTVENSLSAAALRELRAGTDVRLCVFVYGITCMSCHGTCNLSDYVHGAMCAAPCKDAVEIEMDGERRRGCYLRGRDLDLLYDIPGLAEMGIDEIKIEGRMRPPRYVATATAAARHVLDAWKDGREISLPNSLKRRLARLPFFGTTKGCYGSDSPETTSIAVDGGSALNKFLEYTAVPSLRLTAHLTARRIVQPRREGDVRDDVAHLGTYAADDRAPQVAVETSLAAPILPRFADRISIGEKACAQRFLDHSDALRGLLRRVHDLGARPFITIPARVGECAAPKVIDVVRAHRDEIDGVYCHDLGVASILAREMPVTLVAAVQGRADAEALVQAVGADGIRPIRLPLKHYLKSGFPVVPVEAQVFGHVPLVFGVYCLTRALDRCPTCYNLWWRITSHGKDLRVDGNCVYSGKPVSAHAIQQVFSNLPLRCLVVDTVGLSHESAEAVVRFWKGDAPMPDVGPESWCDGFFLADRDHPDAVPVPWSRTYIQPVS